jgi:uncharacterized membrane protein YeiB
MSVEAETLIPTMLDSEPIAAEEAAPRPEPVAANERVAAVDVLRGFALLGILAMNIVAFAWPEEAYDNPTRGGGVSGLDRVIWVFNHLFFDMINFFGSVLVALGHVGALMLIYKAGRLTWLTSRLAAVGRMALTNYLTHSIVCTTLFYGYGFGAFGHVNRTGLAGIVMVIWVVQMLASPIWLERFRFGPAEWLWRSLTYWRLQSMVRRAEPLAA